MVYPGSYTVLRVGIGVSVRKSMIATQCRTLFLPCGLSVTYVHVCVIVFDVTAITSYGGYHNAIDFVDKCYPSKINDQMGHSPIVFHSILLHHCLNLARMW